MPLVPGILLGKLEKYQSKSSQNKIHDDETLFLSFSPANSKSEGYMESTMRNLKQEDFAGRKCLRADVFVHENYDRIRRCKQNYADHLDIHLLPQKKKNIKRKYQKKTKGDERDNINSSITLEEKSFHEAEEKWGKKIQKHQNVIPKLDSISNHQPYLLAKLQI